MDSSYYKIIDFKVIGDKPAGHLRGAIYQKIRGEDSGSIWFTKHNKIGDAIKEYIASKIYNHYLPSQTPIIILLKNKDHIEHGIATTGAKELPNYKNLIDYKNKILDKPTIDEDKILLISRFLGDIGDLKSTNIGLIENDKHYSFARIDFDAAFSFDDGVFTPKNLLDYSYGYSFKVVGKRELCKAAKYILKTPFSKLEEIIDDAYKDLIKYLGKKKLTTEFKKQIWLGDFDEWGNKEVNEYIKNKLSPMYDALNDSISVCGHYDDDL